MSTADRSRWIAAQATALAVVLVAGLVAALTLQPPAAVGPDTLRLVGSASQAAAQAGSFRMAMDFSVRASGLEIQLDGAGEVDAETGEGRGSVDVPGGGTIRFLTTGQRAYFELPEASPMRLGSKKWVGFPVPASEHGLMQDPLEFLRLLSGDGEILDMGEDEVRGLPTRRYRSAVDLASLVDLIQEQQGDALTGAQPVQLEGDAHADVWLSDDGLPRRIRTEFTSQGMTAVCSFDLFDYGIDVEVAPPPAAEVIEVDSQAEAGQFLTGS